MSFYKRFIEPHREEILEEGRAEGRKEGRAEERQSIMKSLQASDDLTPNEKAWFASFIGAL